MFKDNGAFGSYFSMDVSFFHSPDPVGVAGTGYVWSVSQIQTERAYPRPAGVLPSFSLRIMKIHRLASCLVR